MGFEADDPVHHVHSRLLQRSRPLDICGLIKSRLELNDHRDLFPALGRLGQGTDDLLISAGPIKRLLDGQDIRILGRLLDEIEYRLKAFVGMMQ